MQKKIIKNLYLEIVDNWKNSLLNYHRLLSRIHKDD